MKIILSTIEDAYSKSHVLDRKWHDFAASFSSLNRQKSFLGGRALLQESLSLFYGVDKLPKITTLSHGKPVFFEGRYPFFNISHSSKLICLAIGERDLGLDVEYIKPRRNIEGLKKRILSDEEYEYFESLSESEQLTLFTSLWTLRECLIKVSGRGLVDISSIAADIDKRTFEYFSVPQGTEVNIIRLDSVLSHEGAAFLSYSTKGGEESDFYIFRDGKIQKTSSPEILYHYKKLSL
jgi:phosphopantetheinyl transferase